MNEAPSPVNEPLKSHIEHPVSRVNTTKYRHEGQVYLVAGSSKDGGNK